MVKLSHCITGGSVSSSMTLRPNANNRLWQMPVNKKMNGLIRHLLGEDFGRLGAIWAQRGLFNASKKSCQN